MNAQEFAAREGVIVAPSEVAAYLDKGIRLYWIDAEITAINRLHTGEAALPEGAVIYAAHAQGMVPITRK